MILAPGEQYPRSNFVVEAFCEIALRHYFGI